MDLNFILIILGAAAVGFIIYYLLSGKEKEPKAPTPPEVPEPPTPPETPPM